MVSNEDKKLNANRGSRVFFHTWALRCIHLDAPAPSHLRMYPSSRSFAHLNVSRRSAMLPLFLIPRKTVFCGHFGRRLRVPMIYCRILYFSKFSASPRGKMPFPTLCFQEVISFVRNVPCSDIPSRHRLRDLRLFVWATTNPFQLRGPGGEAKSPAPESCGHAPVGLEKGG